jgi:UDP-N-acetylmuramate dehydrogenase
MNLIQKAESIKKKISSKISFNENLSKFSWFNLGGAAKVVFRPENLKELSFFLKEIKDFNTIKVLGAGSNTLIRDGGFDGVIIKFGKSFSHISLFDSNTIIAGASVLDKNISNFALENSLSGFEFLSCIPGTIGGAVRMNSGCYGQDVSKILVSIQAMDLNGNIKIIKSSDIKFYYRGSDLAENLVFISATFKGKKIEKSVINKNMNDFIIKKKNDQPSKIKTCGSTFKNPLNNKAWKLIKDSGCEKMKVGDAQFSDKHCNFLINKGNAKSKDFESLIQQVKSKVLNKTGINLELEIKVIGENL